MRVELYRIAIGSTVYTLTSASEDQTHSGEVYDAIPMGRGGTQQRADLTKASMDVNIPLDHPLAILLMGSWLEQIATLTIFRKKASGTTVFWKGRLTGTMPGDASLKMAFESIFTSMRRPGCRGRYQKTCRHALYGRGCYVDPEEFSVAGTLTAINGRVLTVTEAGLQADGYFSGGMIKAPDGSLTYIAEHDGTALTLNRLSASLAKAFAATGSATAVEIYPGCNHSYAECDLKFDNGLNYGGFDFIPTKNPMGGSSIV